MKFLSDLGSLKNFFVRSYNEIIVISFSTLFIILHHHHGIENFWLSSFIYFGVFPVLTILIFLRKNPLNFGLGIGDYRVWLPYVVIFLAIAIPVLYFSSDVSSVQRYYQTRSNFDLLRYPVSFCLKLFLK